MVQRDPRGDGATGGQQHHQALCSQGAPGAGSHSRGAIHSFEKLPHHRHRDQRPEALAQADAAAVDQLPGGGDRDTERGADLGVAPALHLALDEGLALGLGKGLDPGDHRRQLLASLERLRRLLDAVEALIEMVHGRARVADVVEAGVADDRVEPGTQM